MRQSLGYRRGVKLAFVVVLPHADDPITFLNVGSSYFVDRFVSVILAVPCGRTIIVDCPFDLAAYLSNVYCRVIGIGSDDISFPANLFCWLRSSALLGEYGRRNREREKGHKQEPE